MIRYFAFWGIFGIAAGCVSSFHHEQNPGRDKERVEITIAANSDLSKVLTQLSQQYETENKRTKVIFVFAASGILWNQAKHGAPFDALIVASPEYLRDLKTVGKPVTLAYGQLAFYGDSPPSSLDELENFQGALVIANPKTAPYGKVAETLLKAQHWYGKLKERILITQSVRDAKITVDKGVGDVGLISLTQALEGPKQYSLIETSLHVTITGAALKAGEGEAFLKWLSQPKQQGVFAQHGLRPAHVAEVHHPKGIRR